MPNPKFKEFGRAEYRDRIDTNTILSILIAFTIPIFAEAFKHIRDLSMACSYFAGAVSLIFFMLYTVDYYEKIWIRWYSLPDDFSFFRVFSLFFGVIVIAAMNEFPQFWYWYLSLLFFVLTKKKYSIKNKYIKSFDAEFGSYTQCESTQMQCRYLLAENMAHNFWKWGLLLSIPVAILLTFLYIKNFVPIDLDVPEQLKSGLCKIPDVAPRTETPCKITGNSLFIALSILYTAILAFFWLKKIRVGLSFMVTQVEKGSTDFFINENR